MHYFVFHKLHLLSPANAHTTSTPEPLTIRLLTLCCFGWASALPMRLYGQQNLNC